MVSSGCTKYMTNLLFIWFRNIVVKYSQLCLYRSGWYILDIKSVSIIFTTLLIQLWNTTVHA